MSSLRVLTLVSMMGMALMATQSSGSEDTITLMCDDFEHRYETLNGELFCTVSGFIVSHNQNVKIQKYSKANMTKFMKFYDSRLLYVPYKLFDVFNSLKTLDVSSTEILEVSRNTFGSAGNLSFLNMSSNNITDITTSVFMGATNLMRLDLSWNKISKINEFAFQGLPNLNKIQLSHNQLRDIHQDIFLENPYVEIIALDNNLIEHLDAEVFSRLRRVRDVDLSFNQLHHIDPNMFKATYGLETLVLSSNQITEFHLTNKSILSALHVEANRLTSITINGTKLVGADHNNISTIDIINPVYVEHLQLSYNNITDLTNVTNVTSLQYLDLSYNPLGDLKINTFSKLKRLHRLSLRSTRQQHLSFGMFSKQLNLENLDLSLNNLSELNLDIFVPYLNNLKFFYVDGNNLTEIKGKYPFSRAFPNLYTLGISQNHFNCTYLHWLLVPPNLSTSVLLHIERDNTDEETSHIRDVSCISDTKTNLRHAKHDLQAMTELQRIMQHSMERLEVYILLLKIALLIIVCLLLGMITVRLWRAKRVNYFTRRSGSIVFHSTATVNNNL